MATELRQGLNSTSQKITFFWGLTPWGNPGTLAGLYRKPTSVAASYPCILRATGWTSGPDSWSWPHYCSEPKNRDLTGLIPVSRKFCGWKCKGQGLWYRGRVGDVTTLGRRGKGQALGTSVFTAAHGVCCGCPWGWQRWEGRSCCCSTSPTHLPVSVLLSFLSRHDFSWPCDVAGGVIPEKETVLLMSREGLGGGWVTPPCSGQHELVEGTRGRSGTWWVDVGHWAWAAWCQD